MPPKKKFEKPPELTDADKKQLGWKYSKECRCCNALDREGQPLRQRIDDKAQIGWTTISIASWLLKKHNVKLHRTSIGDHIRNHSPHIRTSAVALNLLQKNKKLLMKVQKEFADSNEALQRIINIGDYMIRTGMLPVTEKMYLKAIEEQGKRRVEEKLDKIMLDMEKEWIEGVSKKAAQEGEIVEENGTKKTKQLKPGHARPVQKKLGKRFPQPGTVRNFVHV